MTLGLRFFLRLLASALAAGTVAAQVPADKIYTEFGGITMPELPGTEGTPEEPQAAVQRLLPPPPGVAKGDYRRVFVRFVVEKDGGVSLPQITQSASTAADSAVLAAVRRLPRFRPGQRAGQPVRVALAVGVWPGGVPALAANPVSSEGRSDSVEARTLRRGTAERIPGEEVSALLARVLPASFAEGDKPITYAWHPGNYGPQLFFSAPGRTDQQQEYERILFVLDPIGPTTYAVQAVNLGSQGDYTGLTALFFADANHDGQKDLLALTQCSLREGPSKDAPLGGRSTHYETTAIYYQGLDRAGQPRYEQQVLANLADVATAAEVRRRLAPPAKRTATPATKAAPAARR